MRNTTRQDKDSITQQRKWFADKLNKNAKRKTVRRNFKQPN